MTISLPTRASALRERLTHLDHTRSNVAEASNLEGLRSDLSAPAESLSAQLDKHDLLVNASIPIAAPPSLGVVRKRATGLLDKFATDTTAATLKKGQGWKQLLGEIDTASRELATAVVAAWRGYRQTVFAGDTPAAIRTRLARTKSNDAAFERYHALYAQLKAAFEALPQDRSAIDRVKEIATKLEQAAQAFDFDVPHEVKLFLEAVQSVGGAPLRLLSPAVQQWLKDNDSFDSYRISASGHL
jgi:hypothetical protein